MRSLSALVLALCFPFSANAAPQVVTDIPVVQGLTASILGEDPVLLMDAGADPHSFQLRPSQARALGDADLVIWVGPEMTPWLERALASDTEDKNELRLLTVDGVTLREFDEHHGDHGHSHDHSHDHHHAATDPHAWLEPDNAAVWLRAIADALAIADPANAATYADRADQAIVRIAEARETAKARLAPVGDRPIVVFHDAYGYFANSFDVTVAGSIALGDAAAPGAKHLHDLRDTISGKDVICIFREPQHNPDLAKSLAEDMGLGLGTLDPTGATLEPGADLYPRLLVAMADAIAECIAAES